MHATSANLAFKHGLIFSLGIAFTYIQATEEETTPSAEMHQILGFFEAGEQGERMLGFFHSMLRSGPATVIDLRANRDKEECDGKSLRAEARAWFGMDM